MALMTEVPAAMPDDAMKADDNRNFADNNSAEISPEDDQAPSTTSTAEISVEEGDVGNINAVSSGGEETAGAGSKKDAASPDKDAPESASHPSAVTPETPKEKDVIALTPNISPRNATESDKSPDTDPEAAAAGDAYDSSDDESSYFRDPRNLPDPKRERRYSYSSNNSAHAHSSSDLRNIGSNAGRESDASLSFSEDSDDGQHHHHRHSPHPQPDPAILRQQIPQHQIGPDLFPQRITRMHSYNSLVSDGAEEEELSSSDPSIRDELRKVASDAAHNAGGVPSGRISPILGEHPPSRGIMFFNSPSSVPPESSPPPISMPGYQPPGAYHHPQPHNLTPDQLAAWVAASTAYQQQQVVNPYGPPMNAQNSRPESSRSLDSNLDYSEESAQGDNLYPHIQQFAAGQAGAPRGPPANSGRNNASRGGPPLSSEGRGASTYGSVTGGGESKAQVATRGLDNSPDSSAEHDRSTGFKVYWRRWLMLMYMSVLNLLSDWTCYSVAPIALLTEQAFGQIDPELLVTVFLGANAVASACEPIILSRLGLRRTVLFGALLLMLGSIIKSGGMPPIISSNLEKGQGEWRVYLGFFLVGLSQPLYQCTPALLSASWFPEVERTMATGVALNANQLGIGFAFIFGTLLVAESDDIPGYFGVLSMISTITFLGALIQFEDAPPTPPSDTARVMRGDLDMHLPSVKSVFDSIRNFGSGLDENIRDSFRAQADTKQSPPARGDRSARAARSDEHGARRRNVGGVTTDNFLEPATTAAAPTPSGANFDTAVVRRREFRSDVYPAPSPASNGAPVGGGNERSPPPENDEEDPEQQQDTPWNPYMHPNPYFGYPYPPPGEGGYPQGAPYNEQGAPPSYPPVPPGYQLPQDMPHPEASGVPYPPYPYMGYPPPPPYWDPRFQQYAAFYQQQAGHQQHPYAQPEHQYHSYQHLSVPYYVRDYEAAQDVLPRSDSIDEGVEPVLTLTPHHLDIDIRDDQVLLSIKACMARPGFVHALVSFTVSGIVINTLSTFMDYLVRLNGAGREYTGIVGGAFQFIIMISSLIIGKVCDKTRAYYSIAIGMLVLGAFGLAECGVSLDADRGSDLRWSLIVVALLVGPLQPVSTELGVDVVYPLSENTVLVIQQLFSNLLSALFIPAFKAMKDVSLSREAKSEHPEFTFSFYLLIVLHAAATVFFATFNGRYLRYEHEMEKKALDEKKKAEAESTAFHRVDPSMDYPELADERMPLINPVT